MLIQSQPTQSFAVSTIESQGHTNLQGGPYLGGSSQGNNYHNGGLALGLDPRDICTYSTTMNGSILSIPRSWSKEPNEDMLVNVYRFVKSFVGSTGSGQGTIDNRIEQAMDLVKSHLMSAVRSEVEELREKITKLEESVTVLSRENEYLRANANQDVLATMGGGRTHQPSDNNLQ